MNVIGQVALGTLGLGLWGARSVLILTLLGGGGSAPEPQPTVTPTNTPTASASVTSVAPSDPTQDDDEAKRRSSSPHPSSSSPKPKSKKTTSPVEEPDEDIYYANCAAARRAGVAPIYAGEPGYRLGLDRNRDGVACE